MPSSPGGRMDLRFVLVMGIVSMLADWLYEGARSIWPQYLAQLGASALLVGLAFGAGDAVGYLARLATGPLADRRGGYWLETFAGLGLQAVAVAALAVAWDPHVAAALVFLERFARALRVPSRDRLLAAAAGEERGRAFGIHGALDKAGAILGSLTAAAASAALGLRPTFLVLAAVGAAALVALAAAYRVGPRAVGSASAQGGRRADPLYALALFLTGLALMPIAIPMYGFGDQPWLGATIYLSYVMGYVPLSLALGGLHDRRPREAAFLGPLAAAAATACLATGSYPALLLGAAASSAAVVYAEVVAAARVAGGGATALGIAGAAYGLGTMAAGAVYGGLVQAGATAWAVPVSVSAVSAALLLTWIRSR